MKLRKAAMIALKPSYWPALLRGVAPTTEHLLPLAGIDPSTILDVGANKGQFSYFALKRWPKAEIHAFEPLPIPRIKLAALMRDRAIIYGVALGDVTTSTVIHIPHRDDSSSLRPIGPAQVRLMGDSRSSTTIVQVCRLDGVCHIDNIIFPALLKIDVQGFEFEVLNGAGTILDNIKWVYLEVSFIELYVGQKLFFELDQLLEALGFRLLGLYNIHRDDSDQPIQADALYERAE